MTSKRSDAKDSLSIRAPQVSDAAKLLNYCKIIGGESHNLTFGSEGIGMTLEEEQKWIRDTANHPLNRQWIAVVNQEIAGFCDLHVAPRSRMAHRASFGLSVRKAYWHQGIATALLKAMMDYAQSQPSIAIIAIEVVEDNDRAIALYERFGFQKVGYLQKFFRIDDQELGAYIMDCDLTKRRVSYDGTARY